MTTKCHRVLFELSSRSDMIVPEPALSCLNLLSSPASLVLHEKKMNKTMTTIGFFITLSLLSLSPSIRNHDSSCCFFINHRHLLFLLLFCRNLVVSSGIQTPNDEVCSLGGSFCTDETSQIDFFFMVMMVRLRVKSKCRRTPTQTTQRTATQTN